MLNDIIALNNLAIASLQRRGKSEDAKAIKYLYEALCRLRKRFPHLTENDTKEKLSSARVSACNRFSRRPIKRRQRPFDFSPSNGKKTENKERSVVICKVPIIKKQQKQEERSAPSDSNENLLLLYQHAFIISFTTDATSMGKQLNTQIYIVLLYNIGLALQMEGTSSNSEVILKKAQRCYELAMSMVAIEWKDIDPDELLLLLAISNNLGRIHSHLLNFSETRKFLTWLRHLMKLYQQRNIRGNTISDGDYSFFFTNSLLLEDVRELTCAPTA